MRQIGTIGGDRAELFGDYLLAKGIPNMVEENPSAGNWSVWVESDDHLERASRELSEFVKQPDDPRYRRAEKAAEEIRHADQKKQTRLREQFVNVRTRWSQPHQWNIPLTIVLMLSSIVVTMATKFGNNAAAADAVTFCSAATMEARFNNLPPEEAALVDRDKSNDPRPTLGTLLRERYVYGWMGLGDILRGQVWRLVTPIFFHLSFVHILFNMLWLRDLGGLIERRRGTLVLGVLVLVSAMISNLGENFWSGPGGGGMSGVVYALFGFCWIRGRFFPRDGLGVGQQTVILMLFWLVLCMTGAMGAIGNAAHLVGLIVGIIAGFARITVFGPSVR